MTREYIRDHVAVVAKAFGKFPFPDQVIEIITNKLEKHPRLQGPEGDGATEFALGEGCRFYVEEVNKLKENGTTT